MAPKFLTPAGDNHIVPLQPFNILIRVAQFVLAVVILIFVAVPTHYWGGYDAFGLALFTCIATMILVPYYVVTSSLLPKFYNRWAVLGLDILGVVFWLVSFAMLADWTANSSVSVYTGYSYWKRDNNLVKRSDSLSASRALAGTSAALGAVEFVLFIVALVFFSLGLHKHRTDGYHSTYGSARTAPSATTAPAEPEVVETEVEPKGPTNV